MSTEESVIMSGIEKACVLLMSYGTSVAAEVFKHLTEPEIEQLSAQIIKMQNVDPAMMQAVLAEFEVVAGTSGGVSGRNFAAEVLEQAMGSAKANELMGRASTPGRGRPFGSLWELSPTSLARLLKDEHPQISALVLTYLPAAKAASVLAEFDEEMQAEVAHRICIMEEADPDALAAIEETLQTKLSSSGGAVAESSGGPKILVEILNNVERSTERNVLDSLAANDPEIGEKVRDLIFTFEDLPKLDDRTIQLVLREVEQEDLRLALKGSDEDIQALVFKNMSERAAEMLKEDLELVGNARAKDIEAAQQKLVFVIRRLIASGEAIMREVGGGDEQTGEADIEAPMAANLAMDGGSDTTTPEGTTDDESDQMDLAA